MFSGIVLSVHFLYLHKENEPKESAAVHLVCLRRLPCAARKEGATSGCRTIGAPPSRLSDLCCAARLREKALIYQTVINYSFWNSLIKKVTCLRQIYTTFEL